MIDEQNSASATEFRQRLEQQIKRAREATRSTAGHLRSPSRPAIQWSSGPGAGSSLERVGGGIVSVWRRPRIRLGLIGVLLVILGALKVIGSMWAVPVIIVGIVMVVIAWVGSRLEGRFAIEWGEEGTQFEMRARLAPYQAEEPEPASSSLETADVRGQLEAIEGEAHTVELRVAELRELIAAAQSAEAGAAANPDEPDMRQPDDAAA